MIEPSGVDKLALSGRKISLRGNAHIRAPREVTHFFHEQSISPADQETKGSVGVFLSRTDCSDSKEVYAVTAAHVLAIQAVSPVDWRCDYAGEKVYSVIFNKHLVCQRYSYQDGGIEVLSSTCKGVLRDGVDNYGELGPSGTDGETTGR